MATQPYSAEGEGLFGYDFAGARAPFRPQQPYGGGGGGTGAVKRIGQASWTLGGSEVLRGLGLGGLFGDKKKERPKLPKWQSMANREWGQGMAALSAQEALYEPTLALAQRSAQDYGDLYRRAANEALAHDIKSNRVTREADLGDYMEMGPQLLAARRQADPLFSSAYDLAEDDLEDVNAPLPANVVRDISENVRGSQVRRGMGLGGSDAFQEALKLTMEGENMRNMRRDRAFGQARSLLDIYGDPFQSLTGRVARSAPQGFNVSGPQSNIDTDDLLSYGVNREIQQKNLKSAQRAQNMQLIGSVIEGVGSAAGGFMCWVAREVFGEGDPRWIEFRQWLLHEAPARFRRWYLAHGEAFAAKLKTRPRTKARLRRWMEAKIAGQQASRPAGQQALNSQPSTLN